MADRGGAGPKIRGGAKIVSGETVESLGAWSERKPDSAATFTQALAGEAAVSPLLRPRSSAASDPGASTVARPRRTASLRGRSGGGPRVRVGKPALQRWTRRRGHGEDDRPKHRGEWRDRRAEVDLVAFGFALHQTGTDEFGQFAAGGARARFHATLDLAQVETATCIGHKQGQDPLPYAGPANGKIDRHAVGDGALSHGNVRSHKWNKRSQACDQSYSAPRTGQ